MMLTLIQPKHVAGTNRGQKQAEVVAEEAAERCVLIESVAA